jgi:hypothetical protein
VISRNLGHPRDSIIPKDNATALGGRCCLPSQLKHDMCQPLGLGSQRFPAPEPFAGSDRSNITLALPRAAPRSHCGIRTPATASLRRLGCEQTARVFEEAVNPPACSADPKGGAARKPGTGLPGFIHLNLCIPTDWPPQGAHGGPTPSKVERKRGEPIGLR